MPVPQLVVSPPSAPKADFDSLPSDSYNQLFITAADWERYPGISRSPPSAPPMYSRKKKNSSSRHAPRVSVDRAPPPPVMPVDLPSPIVFEAVDEREGRERSWSRRWSSSSSSSSTRDESADRAPRASRHARTDSRPASAYAAAASAAVTSAIDAVDTTLRRRSRHAPPPQPIGLPLPADESFDASEYSGDDAELDEKKAQRPQRTLGRRISWFNLAKA